MCIEYGDLSLEEFERRHILFVLNLCKWKKSKTAELLNISRPTLDKKIKKYNLRKENINF